MRLRNRFLLVGSGVIVFIIITPVLVLYARGFTVDWQNRTVTKTGALVVRSQPEKAEIYIDNEKYDDVTPVSIRFLLPADYDVRIEKAGYQSWTKRLSVRTQLVTWANMSREFITLFYANPVLSETRNISEDPELFPTLESNTAEEVEILLKNSNIEIPNFGTQKIIRADNQIYLILDNTLYFINDGLEKIYSPVTSASWNSEVRQILYWNDNEIYTYYADWNNSDLIVRSLTNIENPILNPETGYLFYENEGKIKAIELDNRDHRNVYTITDAKDMFNLSDNGKELYILSGTEIKTYQIR